jgi:hypothetical protein
MRARWQSVLARPDVRHAIAKDRASAELRHGRLALLTGGFQPAFSQNRSARLTSPSAATLAAQIATIQASRFHHGAAALIEAQRSSKAQHSF